MSLAETIADSLGGKKSTPGGYLCRCPCHDDSSASLSLADTPSGGVAINCFAGCTWEDIKAEITSRGLLRPRTTDTNSAGPTTHANSNGTHHQQPEAIYSYYNAEGNVVFQKIRYPGKKFTIRRPDPANPGQWINNLQGINEKPLYNLPKVLEALKNGHKIAILEGEKDCDNFTRYTGIVATTNFDGASNNKWKEHYSKTLTGADVVLLYDNDPAGKEHRDQIISSLKQYARSIVVRHLPTDCKDFSDWMAIHGSDPDNYQQLAIDIIQCTPRIEAINVGEWLRTETEPQQPILTGVFDRADKVVIIGQSKTRKSFFSQQLAFCLASGRDFLGFGALEPRKVLLIQSEIKQTRYHGRCARMAEKLGMTSAELAGLLVVNSRGVSNQQQLVEDMVIQHKPDVVVVDPFYKLIAGDESKSEDVKPILKFFDSLAERTGASIIYVHHDRKGISGDQQLTDRGSGTGILGRDYDSAIYLAPHKDERDTLVVEFITRNYAPVEPITIQWWDAHFQRSDASAEKKTSRNSLNGPKKDIDHWVTLARGIVREKVRKGITELGMASFNAMLEDADIRNRRLAAIKEHLILEGTIKIKWNKGKRDESCKIVMMFDTEQHNAENFDDLV